MNRKTTKRALCMSFVSLLLCCSMLVGSTFAWFTDTATTSVNTIQSGTLDVALEMKNAKDEWVNAEGQTLDFVYAGENPNKLWEPGCTYKLPELRIVNKGNLYLKYQIVITGIKGDAKLNEAIEWTFGGVEDGSLAPEAKKEITIQGHMREDAGNEYQNLTIDGIAITVLATQKDAEFDSFDNKYDENADFDLKGELDDYVEFRPEEEPTDPENPKMTTVVIKDAAGLAKFAQVFGSEETKDITTVEIVEDISLEGYNWQPINAWYPENSQRLTINGNGNTISDMTVNGGSKLGFIGSNARDITIKDLTFDNANVTTSGSMAGVVIGYQYGDVVLDNVDVTNSTVKTTAEKGIRIGGLIGQSFLQDGATLEIYNCDLDKVNVSGYHNVAGMVGSLMNYSTLTDKWEIKNNSITNSVFTITSDSMSNESYISAFACEGGNYGDANKYTWADVNVFARAGYQGPNTADHNTYNIPEQLDPNATYINTVDQLKTFRDAVNAGDNYLNKNVYLAADLDLNNEEWTPIGTATAPFQGNFSGRGHTISNLKITSGENVGLFGHITLSPSNYTPGIRNLTLNNVTITAANSGAFVGNANTTTNNAGNGGALQLIDLKLTGDVKIEGANVGGVMGTEWTNFQIGASDITIAVNEGSYVKGTGRVGGVFASTPHGSVSNITSNIDVVASGETVAAGGVVGCAGWTLTDVTCTGDVIVTGVTATESGKYQVGKIVGCEANNSYWSLYNAPVEGNANRGLGSEFENFTATGAISITLSDSTGLTANGLTAADHRGTDNLIDYTQNLVGAPVWAWAW